MSQWYITAPRQVKVTKAWKRQTPRVNSPVIVKDINGNILRVEDTINLKRKAKVAKRKATNKRKAKAKRDKVVTAKVSRVENLAPSRLESDLALMRKLGSIHLDDN